MEEKSLRSSEGSVKRWKSVFKGGIWRSSSIRTMRSCAATPSTQPPDPVLEEKPLSRIGKPRRNAEKIENVGQHQASQTAVSRKPSVRSPRKREINIRGPSMEAGFGTYQATLSSSLPSGTSMDPSDSSYQASRRSTASRWSNSCAYPFTHRCGVHLTSRQPRVAVVVSLLIKVVMPAPELRLSLLSTRHVRSGENFPSHASQGPLLKTKR